MGNFKQQGHFIIAKVGKSLGGIKDNSVKGGGGGGVLKLHKKYLFYKGVP